jgi:hypothetical protein
LHHFKKNHKGDMPSEGMSLLDMGFTRDSDTHDQLSEDALMETKEEGGPSSSPTPMAQACAILIARAMQPPPRQATSAPIPTAIAEMGLLEGHPFWRVLGQQLDTVIKANYTAQVILSAQIVAEEVLRHQHQRQLEEHGTGVSRELWTNHTTVPCMVREI